MNNQLDLFMGPLVDTPSTAGLTIDEAFNQFHTANPWVYDALVTLTRDYVSRRPGRRVGIAMMFEVLRWQYHRKTTGDLFKLNNNYRSRYARKIMAEHADLADAFEIRWLRS